MDIYYPVENYLLHQTFSIDPQTQAWGLIDKYNNLTKQMRVIGLGVKMEQQPIWHQYYFFWG